MEVTLYQLRKDGARVRDAEWQNQPLGPGVLSLHFMSGKESHVKVLNFSRPNPIGGTPEAIIRPLFEPEWMGLGGTRMNVRGFQTTQDGHAVVQERLCELA